MATTSRLVTVINETTGHPTVENVDANLFGNGTLASRPASGTVAGDMYIVIDPGSGIFRIDLWDGATWQPMQGSTLCRVATTADVVDLAAGAPDPVDGVSLSLNDRILVQSQTTAAENGIYTVTTVGTGANGTWVRAEDADEDAEVIAGAIIAVGEGTAHGGSAWLLATANPIVVGTTPLNFSEITNSIHSNVDGEINAISEKVSPVGTDVLLIEDSASSFAKKRIQITNLPGGVGGSGTTRNVRLATNEALPVNTAAGSGVGKTLTADGNGALTVDGVAVANGNLVLVKNETPDSDNGIYAITDLGSAGTPYILTRDTTYDEASEVTAGGLITVAEGTANADTLWQLTSDDTISVDSSGLTYTIVVPLSNFTATAAPTATDDVNSGYSVGSIWMDVTNDTSWVCVDATANNAIWRPNIPGKNIITVATQGGDFTSIKTAVDSISGSSISNPFYVSVGPGAYTEAPFTVPTYTTLYGNRVYLTASNNGADFITLTAETFLDYFNISGPTTSGFAGVVGTAAAINCAIHGCNFIGGDLGIHAKASVTLNARVITCSSSVETSIRAEAGGSVNLQVFELFSSTTGVFCTGTGSKVILYNGVIKNAVNGLYIDDGGDILPASIFLDGCTNAIRIGSTGTGGEINGAAITVENSTSYDLLTEQSTGVIKISGGLLDTSKFSVSNYNTLILHYLSSKTDDEAFQVQGELHVGLPELGKESVFGEGDSYADGVVVITSDGTATSTTEGGNLTNISTNAESPEGSTFSFQGVTTNYTIMFGSTKVPSEGSIPLKHWGIKFKQTTAAVEVTPRSFIFEIWDGSIWAEIGSMATHSDRFYRYANELFIRANLSEHVRFGVDTSTTWARKTISTENLFWCRIRITTTITTAPVFEQIKLSTSRFEANQNGTNTFHGLARFQKTLIAGANFGESGGVTASNIAVGTGGLPTGWDHNTPNNLMNQTSDAIYTQIILPKGIDTSFPLTVDVMYLIVTGGPGDFSLISSVLPLEVVGVLEADPTGGVPPIARTITNTETVTDNAGQIVSIATVNATDQTRLRKITFGPYDISSHYEGDAVLFRLEMEDDGPNNVDLVIMGYEVSGVFWTLGEIL